MINHFKSTKIITNQSTIKLETSQTAIHIVETIEPPTLDLSSPSKTIGMSVEHSKPVEIRDEKYTVVLKNTQSSTKSISVPSKKVGIKT